MADKKIRVCLSAGHYSYYNRSPANKNYYESVTMWKLHLMVKKDLEDLGFEVILPRDNIDTNLALTERGKKSIGCDVAIELHSNAVTKGVNEKVDHATAYCLTDDKSTKIDEISREIGDVLTKAVTEVMELKESPVVTARLSDNDRNGDGVMNDNYYAYLHGARLVGTPAIILENSFHTNTRSTNWLLKDENLKKLAKAIADALAKYFCVTKKEEEPIQKINALSGKVEVTYKGADGLNIRKAPSMGNNVAKVVHGGTYTVVGISADGDWYKLDDGLYITTNTKYVKFTKAEPKPEAFKPYMIKVDVSEIYDHELSIREKPYADADEMGVIKEDMSLTIIEEAKDSSGQTWGLLKGYSKYKNGWINLYYVKKV